MLPSSPVVIGAAAVIALLVLLIAVRPPARPSSEARESKRAHDAAQKREPPVAIGETYEFGVTELTDHHSGKEVAVGKVEGFVLHPRHSERHQRKRRDPRQGALLQRGRTSADATFVTKA